MTFDRERNIQFKCTTTYIKSSLLRNDLNGGNGSTH